ncbi:MAG: LamG-like jellyroll fold domain-containing protein [Saprospiraceae bacterium]
MRIRFFLVLILITVVCITGNFLSAQTDKNLISYFSFDSCTVKDKLNNASSASVGPLNCACGVEGSSLNWNGGLNFASWDSPALQTLLTSNFTVSFYIKPDQSAVGVMDILSKRSKCGIDSLFTIRYLADDHSIFAELIGRVDNKGSLSAKLPANYCWYQIAFTKNGQKLSLYVNGEEKDFKINNYTISVENKAKVELANSPCLGVTDIRFKGALDELKFYSRALTNVEIKAMYKEVDKLITKDTILVKGQSVHIRKNPSCANSYSWSPTGGIQNATDPLTTISPNTTTTYTLSSTQDGCTIHDSLKVTVVDASALDCNKINLPNAFTPNGDGLNDVFRISNQYVITSMESFEIFDRWGSKVFSGTTPTSSWDGKFGNQPVNPGLFVYHLKYTCNGVLKHKSGSFNLIR